MLGRGERRADRHRPEELGDLLAGEDGFDAIHLRGRAGIDRRDASVPDVGALEREMLHAGDLDVVDVRAETLNQARVFTALDARANRSEEHTSELQSLRQLVCRLL